MKKFYKLLVFYFIFHKILQANFEIQKIEQILNFKNFEIISKDGNFSGKLGWHYLKYIHKEKRAIILTKSKMGEFLDSEISKIIRFILKFYNFYA